MKTQLALLSVAILMTACAGSYPERVVTKGPLICSSNEVCPELAIRWKEETRDGFKITAEINNAQQYDIKQLNFIVDSQPYAYSTINATQYTKVGSTTASSNSITVPVSFLNSFRDAKEIELELVTDQGKIIRPILKANGEKSSAYLTFIKGYTDKLAQ